MPSGFNCLTWFDRCRLQALKKSGFPQRGIAAEVGCSQSTAVRELARNAGLRGCRCHQSQRLAETRRREASSVPRKMSPMSWKIIEICLRSGQARSRLRAAQRGRVS